jgi:hypothetical protein
MSVSAAASFAAAWRLLSLSAFVSGRSADDHLSLDPDVVNWAIVEHAQRLARQAEALIAEIQALGRLGDPVRSACCAEVRPQPSEGEPALRH